MKWRCCYSNFHLACNYSSAVWDSLKLDHRYQYNEQRSAGTSELLCTLSYLKSGINLLFFPLPAFLGTVLWDVPGISTRLMWWGAVSCWTVTGAESLLLTLCAAREVSPKCEHSFHHQWVRQALLLLHRLAAPTSCHQSLSWLWINTSAHCCTLQTPTNCRWMPVYRGIPLPVQIVHVPA